MSDPRRLRDGASARPFDRALLESAREDRAPDGAEERALAALALGAVGLAVVASQGASAPPAAAVVSKLASALALKWLGVGLVVTMAVAAPVTYLVTTSAETPPVAPAASAAAPRPSSPMAAPASRAAAADETETDREPAPSDDVDAAVTVTPSSLPPAPAAAPPPSSVAAASAPAPARSASSLSPELDVLDRARNALAARDPAGARKALDEYQRRFPRGSLREEAELASIETLVLGGDTPAAREAAVAFLAAHPASPYVGRVRAILKRASIP